MGDSKYEAKTIPKDSDGKIMVNEYREQTWHTQQVMLKELKRINGTVGKHDRELGEIQAQVKGIKIASGILAVIFSYFKWINT